VPANRADLRGLPLDSPLGRHIAVIEDRSLLDASHPNKNPAVNWKRFALATAGQAAG